MSEFSYPSKKTPLNFSSLLLSDFYLFCSFVLSHPLYFSYFIFFSPYLIKLLSFLSPLFITTSLLILLVLFTVSPDLVSDSSTSHPEKTESKVSFLLSVYQTIVDKLWSEVENEDQELYCFEELEVYKIVFETSVPENRENHPIEVLEGEAKVGPLASSEAQSEKYFDPEEGFDGNVDENSVEYSKSSTGLLNQEKELDDLLYKKQEKEVKLLSAESNKVEKTSTVSGSNGVGNKIISEAQVSVNSGGDHSYSTKLGADLWCTNGEYSIKVNENSETNLGSFGSMRKEKEWKRTLACKLYEERHNVDGSGGGGEGMDMLWETYEANDSTKVEIKSDRKKNSSKGRSIKDCYEEEEEEDYDDEQLCCLQALKFSAGKMNLGMGRPNLVKISKAFKGFGWLHHVTKTRKKGYQ